MSGWWGRPRGHFLVTLGDWEAPREERKGWGQACGGTRSVSVVLLRELSQGSRFGAADGGGDGPEEPGMGARDPSVDAERGIPARRESSPPAVVLASGYARQS